MNHTTLDRSFARRAAPWRSDTVRACIQCGACTASCPAAYAMDVSPRILWRLVQLGLVDEALGSKTIWLCSLCYRCQTRCPRGIPLTETITRLKELALRNGAEERYPESAAFYRAFAAVIRRYGRIREIELMARFFLTSNPLNALSSLRMGLTMFLRGKIHLQLPRLGAGRMDRLFERVAEMEREP